jgi:hypothetical protein
MPPRRVLPIRSRLESTPNPAGGDAAAAVVKATAGGSSMVAPSDALDFKGKKHGPPNDQSAKKEVKASTNKNNTGNKSGDKSSPRAPALPDHSNVPGMHDIMVSYNYSSYDWGSRKWFLSLYKFDICCAS